MITVHFSTRFVCARLFNLHSLIGHIYCMTGTLLGHCVKQEEMQRSFRLEAANRGPAMSPTQVSLGLEVLTGCQFKIKSYYTKIRKSGFSVRSQIWPLLGPDGGHPSSPELALSKSPKSWLTFSSGMSHLTAAPICQLLTGWPLLEFEVAAPELDAVPAPTSLTIKRHVSYKRSH